MHIRHQQLTLQLQKKIVPLYILIGQEPYFLNESVLSIKASLRKKHDFDEIRYSIQAPEDWLHLLDQANSYSLFSESTLLNVFYDKKTLDAQGKKVLNTYLQAVNTQCFMIIQAPNLPLKQVQWLSGQAEAQLVLAAPLGIAAMKTWIQQQFQKQSLGFEAEIPDLIVQYTLGNMLACAQLLEKIVLSTPPNTQLTRAQVLEHLSDQSVHSLYELAEACLESQSIKAIHILRQAAQNKSEASLVLWILAQEIRLLLQIDFEKKQNKDFKTVCTQFKIWPQRMRLYQMASQRLNPSLLQALLVFCLSIDEQIKSNQNAQVWQSLERLALSLALGESC